MRVKEVKIRNCEDNYALDGLDPVSSNTTKAKRGLSPIPDRGTKRFRSCAFGKDASVLINESGNQSNSTREITNGKPTIDRSVAQNYVEGVQNKAKSFHEKLNYIENLPPKNHIQTGRRRNLVINRQIHRTFCDVHFPDIKPNISYRHYVHPMVKEALQLENCTKEMNTEDKSYVCVDMETNGSKYWPRRFSENFAYDGTKVYAIRKINECLPQNFPTLDYAAVQYNGYIFFYEWFSEKEKTGERSKKKTSYLAKCKHCGTVNTANTTNGFDGLARHLKSCANFKQSQEISETSGDHECLASYQQNPLTIPIAQNQRYVAEGSSSQLLIDNSVLEYIIYEKLPLRKSGSPHLKILLQRCNPNIRVRNEKTYRNYFERRIENQVEPNLRDHIKRMIGTTLVVDHWSTTRKESVTGIRLVGIIDFQHVVLTCAVIKTTGHSAINVAKQVVEVLKRYDAVSKIRFTQNDNAANMVKAMRISKFTDEPTISAFSHFQEDEIDYIESEIAHEEIINALEKGMPKTFNITCKAHSINLGIKAGLKNTNMHNMVLSYQKVVGYIHHCPLIMDELRASPYNCVLQSIGATRWNSTEDSISQALLKGMIPFVNTRLEKVRKEIWNKFERNVERCQRRGIPFPENPPEMPPVITNWGIVYLHYYSLLTQPLSIMLDLFQADGITAPKFLPQCVRTFSDIQSIPIAVDDNSEDSESSIIDIKNFQQNLIKSCCDKLGLQMNTSKPNREISKELLPFLFATVFHPSFKTEWFDVAIQQQDEGFCAEVSNATGRAIKPNPIWLPTSKEVEDILIEAIKNHEKYLNTCDGLQSLADYSPPDTNIPIEEILLQYSRQKLSGENSNEKLLKELKQYLLIPAIPTGVEDFDVLMWWKCHAETFPLLAKLACMYIAFPVSSAAVERLFSELKMYCMGVRNQTEIPMLEKIVKFRESLPSIRLGKSVCIGDCLFPNEKEKLITEPTTEDNVQEIMPTTPKRRKVLLTRRKLFINSSKADGLQA